MTRSRERGGRKMDLEYGAYSGVARNGFTGVDASSLLLTTSVSIPLSSSFEERGRGEESINERECG